MAALLQMHCADSKLWALTGMESFSSFLVLSLSPGGEVVMMGGTMVMMGGTRRPAIARLATAWKTEMILEACCP